ncbi:MAG: hypothetical protein JW860_01635 [Sedimentisphaerales bacterium]|nr:hypothetical protein [Sedimentisphaerales bacterium]
MRTIKSFKLLFVVILPLGLLPNPVPAMEILEPGYVIEDYFTIPKSSDSSFSRFTFDSDGNIFIPMFYNSGDYEGVIYRISNDKEISIFADGLTRPMDLTFSNGTDYGNYLYVTEGQQTAEWPDGGVSRITPEGVRIPFSGLGLNQPVPLGFDTIGNYGGYLYVASGAADKIHKLSLDGQVQTFYNFSIPDSGCCYDIVFDTTGNYGSQMYVPAVYPGYPDFCGVLVFDPSGNKSKFAPDIKWAYHAAFDTSDQQLFGGNLFVVGCKAWDTSTYNIYRVQPNGQADIFVADLSAKSVIRFGPDGFMYLRYVDLDTLDLVIQRIVPERPLPVVKLEEAIALKNQARDLINQALEKEAEALALLNNNGSHNNPDKWDILKARLEIRWAMKREQIVLRFIDMSIARLQHACELIAGWTPEPGDPDDTEESTESIFADINGDGIINAEDLVLLSKYWLQNTDSLE